MTRLILFAASLVAVFVVAGSLGSVRGQRAKSTRPNSSARKEMVGTPSPKPEPSHLILNIPTKDLPSSLLPPKPAPAAAQPQPFWRVSVSWGLQLDANTQALYQHMADLLSGVTAVPNDRLNYYSAVNRPPDWVIGGWTGMVTDVQPSVGGGHVVTVTANPVFPDWTSVTIFSDYSEHYNIDQFNNIVYVGFSDPNNWAGKMPGFANK